MQKPYENIRIIETADGSHTLYNESLDEHYHSKHGSIQESLHVFIEMGLKPMLNAKGIISLLEIGFGTGLNALLTGFNRGKLKLDYVALEPFPVQDKLLNSLNYIKQIGIQNEQLYKAIHQADWNAWIEILKGFRLIKVQETIQEYEPDLLFDLIYFDAFAPRPQPEMWKEDIFQKCHELMAKDGILVTYCAKGEVRRTMQDCGFEVERLPGPPGKREMLRAKKI
ncbi:MAG: tRNA (5-methylaminomethyl-2-thiouridine)(34)-methyltransferase MnmD [Bacteroidota bacterium]